MTRVDLYSYGGGGQSTGILVLVATGRLPKAPMVFSNVGDNAENPETFEYLARHALPYAAQHGIEIVECRWVDRTGRVRDLYDDVMRSERSIPIPVRLASGSFGNRQCTGRYKIDVVAREAKKRGATTESPWRVAIGISTDEYTRAKVGVDPQHPWVERCNPLLDLGLSKTDCARIVADAGLPPAPKSSCWFCPFKGREQWRDLKRNQPGLFAKAVEMEVAINDHRTALGRDRVGLHSAAVPLDEAVGDQMDFEDLDGRDAGWCMT